MAARVTEAGVLSSGPASPAGAVGTSLGAPGALISPISPVKGGAGGQIPGRQTLFRLIDDAAALDLGALFKHSPNAYVIFDVALNIVGCNDAYLTVVGRRSRDEIVGRFVFDAFPSPEGSPSHTLLRRSLDKVIATRCQDHIAVIPYDTSPAGEKPNLRYWSATHTPIFDSDGNFRYILQHTVDVTELQMLREQSAQSQIAEAGVLQRARKVQEANLAISAESEFLKDMFEQAPGFIGMLAGPAHTFILANDSYRQLVGGRELIGLTVAEALPEVVEQGFVDLLDQVYQSGQPYVGRNAAVTLQRTEHSQPQQRYVDFVYQPIRAVDGSVSGIFVQGHDVTEKVEAERLQALRHRELAHRLKNQLAMVQAIVNQTLRAARNVEDAHETVSARLHALASAHESLIAGTSGQTTVDEIVRKILAIHDDGNAQRLHADGPDMPIASRPALSLSLILHELSTNAVKYGALSNESGVVHIEWGARTDGEKPVFFLVWRESGGPALAHTPVAGTGTRLIRAGLSGTVASEVQIAFEPAGVVCELTADLHSFQNEA